MSTLADYCNHRENVDDDNIEAKQTTTTNPMRKRLVHKGG